MGLSLMLVLVLLIVIGVIMLISARTIRQHNMLLIKILILAIGIICLGGGSYLLFYLFINGAL